MSRIVAFCLLLVFAALPQTRAASAADAWTVVQSVGEVSVSGQGVQPVSVEPKQDLPNGATITTGDTGRAIIVRGQETIMIAPKSSLVLPAAGADKTTILQRSGTLIFKVGKRPVAHFEVDTPYLAAIVKGTTFTVSVTESGGAVAVHQGAVEVRTKDKGMSVLTTAGQISRVLKSALSEILTTGVLLPADPTDANWSERNEDVEYTRGSKPAWTKTKGVKLKNASASSAKTKPWDAMHIKPARKGATEDIHKTENTALVHAQASSKHEAEKSGSAVHPTAAQPGAWHLTRWQGTVEVDGNSAVLPAEGASLAVAHGAAVRTGTDSGATLTNGRHSLTLYANAQIVLPGRNESEVPAFTHRHGHAEYRIGTGSSDAVSVAAPLLSAMSTDGHFILRTNDAQTLVELVTGRAEIVPHQGSDTVELGGSGRAWVSASAPSTIESQGGKRLSRNAKDNARLSALAELFAEPSKSAKSISAAASTESMLRRVSYQTAQLELPGTTADFAGAEPPRTGAPGLTLPDAAPSTEVLDVARVSRDFSVTAAPSVTLPAGPGPKMPAFQVKRPVAFNKKKQEEVRSKGLSVLEMGLFALLGLGLAAGGAVWLMQRRKSGPGEPNAQQVRLRSIAGTQS